jgi:hypothetical protein
MRLLITLLAIVCLAGCALDGGKTKNTITTNDQSVELSNGIIKAVFSTDTGGPTWFGFVDGDNISRGGGVNLRSDESPKIIKSFDVAVKGGTVVLTSAVIQEYGVRLVREIRMLPGQPVIVVTDRLIAGDGPLLRMLGVQSATAVPGVKEVTAKPMYPHTASGQVFATYPKEIGRSAEPWPVPQPSFIDTSEVVFTRPSADALVSIDADTFRVRLGEVFFSQEAKFAPATGKFEPNDRAYLLNSPQGEGKVTLLFNTPLWPPGDSTSGSLTTTWTLWRPNLK